MNYQINQSTTEEKVQVYRNDFLSGFLRLTKKLFMI